MIAKTASFAPRSQRLLFRWLIVGEWRAQPVRALLAVVAIAIGVALGFAVHLINAAALDAFASGIQRVRGAADLEIRATGEGGFDEAIYARLMQPGTRDDPGSTSIAATIAAASPVVEAEVAIAGSRDTLIIIGIDALRAARITPQLIGRPARESESIDESAADSANDARGTALFDPDSIFVSPATLAALGKKIGDTLVVTVAGQPVVLRIAGSLADDEAAAAPARSSPGRAARFTHTATMDIAGAQWRFGRLGKLSRIDIKLQAGIDATRFAASLAIRLPADANIATPADDRARTGDLSRAYRVNLDMLALMALFTGAFLVYSTQSLSVARRRAQLALLRVVGVTRGGVIAQVVGEGAMLGLLGGALGLALGYALASAALIWFGGDLGGGYFRATQTSPAFLIAAAPDAALVFFTLGLCAAMIGSFIPAREAARAAPAVALKSSGESGDASRAPSMRASTVLFAIGAIAAFLPQIASLPLFGYASIALLLFGGIAAMPWLARALLGLLAHRKLLVAVPLDLAIRRLWGAPSQAAVALCGIVASASLMVAMTVMIASFRHSVDAWLFAVLPADLYLRSGGPAGGFSPNEEALLTRVEGVERIDFQKSVALQLAPNRPPVALIAREIDAAATRLPLVAGSIAAHAGDNAIPIWVSEAMVDLYGFEVDKEVALPIGVVDGNRETSLVPGDLTCSPALSPQRGGSEMRSGAAPKFRVLGIWRDYARQFGAIAMRRADYTRLTGDARFTDAAITLSPGYESPDVGARLRAALPSSLAERVEFAEPGLIRAMSLAIFDRSFAITYLLQAVAIGIGLAGVAATFSAQTLARAKEFGMLRHVGVLRRQIVLQLAAEGALLGALGVVAGGALGLAMSQVLIHVVNPQSFHWTMDTSVPWALLATVACALMIASAGAAVLAGRRAVSQDAVLAVREDW